MNTPSRPPGGDPAVEVHVVTYRTRDTLRSLAGVRRERYILRRLPDATVIAGLMNRGSERRALAPVPGVTRHLVVVAGRTGTLPRVPDDLTARWDTEAVEHWGCELVPLSVKGTVDGEPLCDVVASADGRPLAVLTRARVRPRALVRWHLRAAPETYRAARCADGLLAGAAFHETPLLVGGTFSIWPDDAAIRRYAYQRGTNHQRVMQQAMAGRWVSESLFARFAVARSWGTWDGTNPLADC